MRKGFLPPMLTTLVEEPFDDKEWIFETKWDGYRALAHKKEQVKLLSRNGLSFNHKFPKIVQELQSIKAQFVLDGELVMFDEKKRSSFQLLQNYKKANNAYYYVFDLLFYQGHDLRKLPLIERKKILKKFVAHAGCPHLRYSAHIQEHGKKFFRLAKQKKWEGIIAKRKDSEYCSKRSKDWLKIKIKVGQEVVIGGFTEPRRSRKHFGALLVGVYEKKELRYVGHVGGGFNEELLQSIHKKLEKLICKKCPFKNTPHPNAPVTWVRPKLVCEVEFSEWTKDKIMRHPIFQGMRIDKAATQVVQEKFTN